jgi:hypothetical protein
MPTRSKPPRKSASPALQGARAWLEETRSPLMAVVMGAALLLLYGAGAAFLDWRQVSGVDFVTPWLLRWFGPIGMLYFNAGVALVALITALLMRYWKKMPFRPALVVPVLLESLCWALLMGVVITFVIRETAHFALAAGVDPFAGLGATGKVTLALGAGFWEELVFRLGLTGFFLLLFVPGMNLPRWLGVGLAVTVSSILFSLAHYIGPEEFGWYSFVYRSLSGLYFALLFSLRGFAIAAWTHALYDVWVFFS